MLNIIQNTIGAIRRVGESVVRAGLKMWLPFTKAEPLGENLVVNGDFATDSDWGGDAIISDGKATINVVDGAFQYMYQLIPLVNGRAYKLKAKIRGLSGSSGKDVRFQDKSNNTGGLTIANGLVTLDESLQDVNIVWTANSNSSGISISRHTTHGTWSFEVISVSIEEYAQETPDISGNDNNAILKTGKALQFTGNDSVQTSFPSSYTIKTIAFWINPTHSSTNETVFYGGGAFGGVRELYLDHLQLEVANGTINMSTYVNGTLEGVTYGGTPATLTQDEWQRVVLTSSTGFTVVSDTFDIGSGLYGSDGRFIMSDLQIYDEAWTTDDIAYDYANPQKLVTESEDTSITLDNLKAWWHLSEGDGTVAFDSAPLIGKELVVDGDFPSDTTEWLFLEGATLESNGARINNTVTEGVAAVRQTLPLSLSELTGRVFEFSYDVVATDGSTLVVQQTSNIDLDTATVGLNRKITFTWDFSLNDLIIKRRSGETDVTIDNVSLKEVFNIDGETYDGSTLGASYVDAQERIPQLGMMNWSKGSNVLTYSNDFQASSWLSGYVTLDDGYEAPDGTMTAWKLTRNGAQGFGAVYDQSLTSNVGVVRSIWAKTVSGTGDVHLMNNNGDSNSLFTVTNEWQRFSINSTTTLPHIFYAVDFRGSSTLSEVIVWGAQEEVNVGDSLSAFRKTNGSAVTDATLISCATDSQKDILGNAVRVKGSGFNLDGTGYGEVPHSTDFDFGTGDFSVSAWVKGSFVSQGSSINVIFSSGVGGSNSDTSSLVTHSTNKLGFYCGGTTISANSTFVAGNWYHVVGVRDSGTIKLYVDKVLQTSTSSNTNSITNTENEFIGFDNTTSRFYNDLIDDVQVYNRALTPDEVEQNYNATKSGHNN